MRFWFDTEFIEDGKTIDLISIAVVSEDGREYYAENADCDLSKASPWVREHVIPQLRLSRLLPIPKAWIAQEVQQFFGDKPEIWGYYADYDWVVLCQLFGTMMDLPNGWPMYCRDIKQLCDSRGNPKLPEQAQGEHHALIDAHWNRKAYDFLKQSLAHPTPEPKDAEDDALILEALELAARQADDIGSTAMLAESVWIGRAAEFRTAADRFRARSSRQVELRRVVEEVAESCLAAAKSIEHWLPKCHESEAAYLEEQADDMKGWAAKLRSALEKV